MLMLCGWSVCTQGGRQLACDAQTLFSVFQPYTFKPAAHFKEFRDASLLLSLEPTAQHKLSIALQTLPSIASKEKLRQIGVLRLAPDQAISVLQQHVE